MIRPPPESRQEAAMKIIGFGKDNKVDHLLSKDMLDREVARKLQKFLEEVEMAIFSANREVIHKAVPELTRESFMAFAVRVAEARARYIKIALELSGKVNPTPEDIARLKSARESNDELVHAFEATKRLIERGYTSMVR
jgi:hypothetical protein